MLTRAFEVRWRAPLFDVSGYASEAREFVRGLADAGARVRAVPIRSTQPRCALDDDDARALTAATRFPVGRDAVRVEHWFPPRWHRTAAVGRTMFETDRIPDEWVGACNAVAEVWVPSAFNVETFAAAGVDRQRLYVVPSPIRASRWSPCGRRLDLPGTRFAFLSVFDWSLRKGWDVLLRAYCAEFSASDDVVLLLKIRSSSGRTAAELRATIRAFVRGELRGAASARAPALAVVDRTLAAGEMPALYRTADCFVLPTRGEGWGRPFVEAMAVGLPVIATRWSGHTDFVHDGNAYLVEPEAIVPVPDEAAREARAFRGHRWAEPSTDHLRALMRRVYERPGEARERAARACSEVTRAFDVPVVTDLVLRRLAELRS